MSGTANPSWSKAKYAARGVHLDQDTAGRLLESMGDHALREMIVRITQVIRQNPAYRPFANDVNNLRQPSVGGCSRSTACRSMKRTSRIRWIVNCQLFLITYLAGCSSSNPPVAGRPMPPEPTPVPVPSSATSWTFSFTPGAVAYRISRNAAIEDGTDSLAHREISTNSTYESLTLQPAGDTIAFTAVIDTFSITTQGAIGPVQAVELPIQVSGARIGDSLVVSSDSLSEKCSPVTSALITDLHNLLPHFPTSLSVSTSWDDSTSILGCQGLIPTRSHIVRSYRVMGESMYEGGRVLAVQRNDMIQAEGEGTQRQHRLMLGANGTGTATYYLDTVSGRILHLSASQELSLSITASGKTSHFRQTAKQEFALVR